MKLRPSLMGFFAAEISESIFNMSPYFRLLALHALTFIQSSGHFLASTELAAERQLIKYNIALDYLEETHPKNFPASIMHSIRAIKANEKMLESKALDTQ